MFVLDTNVVSELRKKGNGTADPNLVAWEEGLSPAVLFLSVISVFELERGVLSMERRDPAQGRILRSWLDKKVLPAFSGRVLPVDGLVAQRCARLHVPDPRPDRDALIAATALVHGMAVATRNVQDFLPMGVRVVNPWVG